jgi:1,4-alpha-glucan branching enzyme
VIKDNLKRKSKIKSKQAIKRRRVTFSLEATHASEVILMGDFDNWDPKVHPMKNNGNGIWNRTLMIYPGRYEYKFLVDGQWTEDPQNDQNCPNSFGTYNSVINLMPK